MDIKMGQITFSKTEVSRDYNLASSAFVKLTLFSRQVSWNRGLICTNEYWRRTPTPRLRRKTRINLFLNWGSKYWNDLLQSLIYRLRYLDWRDQRSSSRTLGFRIEGTYQDSQAKKDFKSVKSQEDVLDVLIGFIRQNNAKVSPTSKVTFSYRVSDVIYEIMKLTRIFFRISIWTDSGRLTFSAEIRLFSKSTKWLDPLYCLWMTRAGPTSGWLTSPRPPGRSLVMRTSAPERMVTSQD